MDFHAIYILLQIKLLTDSPVLVIWEWKLVSENKNSLIFQDCN